MSAPLVSICIPVFNGGALIDRALKSATGQSYAHCEIVVCDNCSTDETQEVIRTYASADSRIRSFRNVTNIGPVKNILKCLRIAQGEYVIILGHDDWISLNFVEESLRIRNQFPHVAAVVPRSISFGLDTQGKFSFIHEVCNKEKMRSQTFIASRLYRTDIGALLFYSLVERRSFLKAIEYALERFENPAGSLPEKFKDLQRKGFGLDTVAIPKFVAGYPSVTFSNAIVFMKITNAASSSVYASRENLDMKSCNNILLSYGFFRSCFEYVYKTDFPRNFLAMRVCMASEALGTVFIEWVKSKFKPTFFNNCSSEVHRFFSSYTFAEKIAIFFFLPVSMVKRFIFFLVRFFQKQKSFECYKGYLSVS